MNRCLICNHAFFEFVLKTKDLTSDYTDIFSLYMCKQCGLVQQIPVPDHKKLEKFYPKSYQGNLIKNVYEVSSSFRLVNNFFKLANSTFQRILDPYPSILNDLLNINKNIKYSLDIGCGNGKFMKFLSKNTKFNTYGIDFDQEAIEFIKKEYSLPCEHTTISNFKSNRKFDFISMIHFLEHDLNPTETISKIKDLISEKGILYIEVPNSNSIVYDVFGSSWLALDLPRHITHFNKKNLENLLNNCGFEVVNFKYRYFEYSFLYSFFNKIKINKFVTDLKSKSPFFSILIFLIELIIQKPLSLLILPISIFDKTDVIRVYAKPRKK